MRKRHPIRSFFILLLLAAMVAGLAALPKLTKNAQEEGNTASILTCLPEQRTITKTLLSGAPVLAEDSRRVSVPEGVMVREYLVSNGDSVEAGAPIARVDDVSVMTAVKSVQDSLNTISSQLQTARSTIEPGLLSVDDAGRLCVNGSRIAESKLENYSKFLTLSLQHREYEEILLDLFLLHQDNLITAPCSGVVGDLDKTQILEMAFTRGAKPVLLALNTPDGDDDEVYRAYVRQIVGFSEDGSWLVRSGTTPCIVTDFLDMSGVSMAVSETVEPSAPETTFAYANGEWSVIEPGRGDVLLYAYASDNSYWVIRIANVPVEDPTEPTEPSEPTEPTEPGEDPTDPTTPVNPSGPGGNGGNGGGGTYIDWSRIAGSSAAAAKTSSLFSTDRTTLCTVTPTGKLHLDLPVDEMDIDLLEPGMTAALTFEALPNRSFTAEVTEISRFGSSNGGSSKFTVTLEMPGDAELLPGMNAHVTFVLESADCMAIPVAALSEQGSETVVYTGRDEKTGELCGPVPVELGRSDGIYVELITGPAAGQTIYYSYYDVLEISTAVETRPAFG